MGEYLQEILRVVLVGFLGVAGTTISRRIWEKWSTNRLRTQLLSELEALETVVASALQKRSWTSPEVKAQAQRILRFYSSKDSLAVSRRPYIQQEIVEYFRQLDVFMEWFNVGGPEPPNSSSFYKREEQAVNLEDLPPRPSDERFKFAQAQFEGALEMAETEDPMGRRHLEEAAKHLIAETERFLGGGVGSNVVYRRVHSGFSAALEGQSTLFYKMLQTRTTNLIRLLETR